MVKNKHNKNKNTNNDANNDVNIVTKPDIDTKSDVELLRELDNYLAERIKSSNDEVRNELALFKTKIDEQLSGRCQHVMLSGKFKGSKCLRKVKKGGKCTTHNRVNQPTYLQSLREKYIEKHKDYKDSHPNKIVCAKSFEKYRKYVAKEWSKRKETKFVIRYRKGRDVHLFTEDYVDSLKGLCRTHDCSYEEDFTELTRELLKLYPGTALMFAMEEASIREKDLKDNEHEGNTEKQIGNKTRCSSEDELDKPQFSKEDIKLMLEGAREADRLIEEANKKRRESDKKRRESDKYSQASYSAETR
jgi:hypothetical protein